MSRIFMAPDDWTHAGHDAVRSASRADPKLRNHDYNDWVGIRNQPASQLAHHLRVRFELCSPSVGDGPAGRGTRSGRDPVQLSYARELTTRTVANDGSFAWGAAPASRKR
jgi:hypothetical protein